MLLCPGAVMHRPFHGRQVPDEVIAGPLRYSASGRKAFHVIHHTAVIIVVPGLHDGGADRAAIPHFAQRPTPVAGLKAGCTCLVEGPIGL